MTNAKESFEMFSQWGTKGYELARELGELNMRTMETLIKRQMESAGSVMEAGFRHLDSVSEAKGYGDVVKGQVAFAREIGEQFMAMSRENMKLANDTREEYRSWLAQ